MLFFASDGTYSEDFLGSGIRPTSGVSSSAAFRLDSRDRI